MMIDKMAKLIPNLHNAQDVYFIIAMGAVIFVISIVLLKGAFGELEWFRAGDMFLGVLTILMFLLGIAMITIPSTVFFLI